MGLATHLGSTFDSPLPLGEAAEKLYAHIIEKQPAYAKRDFSAVYKYLREQAEDGKKLRLGDVVSE
jgi:3-hydroxyisobutyrate dehydrogenase